MSAMASDLFLVLTVLALLPRAPTTVLSQSSNLCATKANGRFFCPDCSTTASNRGARFEANHLRLQASLQAMPAANASFLKATFAGGDDTDTVYGLAMCFADANWSDCEDCLIAAAAELVKNRCFSRRDMVVWYPACLVRYDSSSFFGAADTSPARRFDVPNPNSFPDPARLNASRARLAARMIAAAEASQDRYAFDVEEITANDTLHGLAQCTEDLPAEECSRCLASYMGWLAGCCAVMEGVRLIGPSCYMRYELMGFVPGTLPSMAPLPESPPAAPVSPPSVPIGNASSRKRIIRYIIAGISSLLVLCLLVLATFLCYKKHHGPLPWNRGSKNTLRIKSFLQNQHPKRYTYSEVKRMTKSFAHKLGQGGNGVVYKGSLPDGREVAVKMLKESKGDSDEFINEVSSISRTSHVNVVTLLGFCLQGSKRGLVSMSTCLMVHLRSMPLVKEIHLAGRNCSTSQLALHGDLSTCTEGATLALCILTSSPTTSS